jgi:hypothetical protein
LNILVLWPQNLENADSMMVESATRIFGACSTLKPTIAEAEDGNPKSNFHPEGEVLLQNQLWGLINCSGSHSR